MADDTLTVDEARQALYKAYDFSVSYVRGDSSHPLTHPDNAIDALIAAVRAEQHPLPHLREWIYQLERIAPKLYAKQHIAATEILEYLQSFPS